MNIPPCEIWARVGSFHMGDPAWKDRDFLMLQPRREVFAAWADKNGWEPCAAEVYMQDFQAFRKDVRNIIVVRRDCEFFGFLAAFHLCRKYKVFDKADRVLIHESLRKRNYTPCTFKVDNNTREVTITGAYNADKDQHPTFEDDSEPPL